MAKFKIALCQHDVRDSVSENLRTAAESVRKAARRGADIAVLPEMFICHFVPAQMRFFAQTLSGDVVKALSKIAEENHIWLVGGSFPESGGENEQAWGPEPEILYGSAPEDGVSSVSSSDAAVLYNTCPVFSPDGALQGSYRKRFLFDVDIPGKVRSCESVVFTPGDRSLIIDTGFVKFGVAICFDIRFPQIFIDMARDGADLIVVPAAFPPVPVRTTGDFSIGRGRWMPRFLSPVRISLRMKRLLSPGTGVPVSRIPGERSSRRPETGKKLSLRRSIPIRSGRYGRGSWCCLTSRRYSALF